MKKIIFKLIKIYQMTFSPDHGFIFFGTSAGCRFYPSCSQYTYEAITHYGLIAGLFKGFLRILRCNPFSKGGVDPVTHTNVRYGVDFVTQTRIHCGTNIINNNLNS